MMDIKKKKNQKELGFNLVEMLVAIAIGLAVGVIVTVIATGGLKNIRHTRNLERLHADAGYINETIAYWIKQAQTVSGTQSSLTVVDMDGAQMVFSQQGSALQMNGVSINSNGVELKANSLNYTYMDASVRISYTLAKTGSSEELAISTTIAHRNIPH